MGGREVNTRRQAIIEAARVTLRERGFEGTRMDDIAGQVGIARPNLYRYFANKEELVRALLEAEILAVNNQRRHRIPVSGPVRDLIVESLLVGAELTMRNELLSVIFSEELGEVAARLVADDSNLMSMEVDYWQPILDHGRRREELDSDMPDARILHWFMTNHYVFVTRPELIDGDIRAWIEDFVVKPVLATPRRPAPDSPEMRVDS
ncbi:TetR/AcrR family transcriptional regulator [Rhodococcus pseudokoreensis]|uniref:TetR/AcrR family transcriptional regulator n=1 Tax=Rhodococcus pseudokoreensis TaxID=2811421 RepID=A0A974ZVJ3_9NOCA|nr:TetR/AcrR family transcriptional regulator [Rhodococcus pseudokoreensis]QSE92091.1 TetR/AcrR family transcriptional regulator [Rhodococcus pseudokoreensis]